MQEVLSKLGSIAKVHSELNKHCININQKIANQKQTLAIFSKRVTFVFEKESFLP